MLEALSAERRKFTRYSCRLKVYLEESNQLLGYAEDIHLEGMRLKSEQPTQENTELKVWFGLSPHDKDASRKISLSMYRVWSGFSDCENRFHYSGMHFSNPSEDALDGIQELIHDLAD